jgi:hypothetical protein
MKRIIAALLLTLVLPLTNAQAQQVSVEKLWFGEYKTGETKEIDDPASPTGKRFESSGGAKLIAWTNNIKLRNDMKFGIGYIVRGTRGKVELEHIYFVPDDNGRTAVDGAPAFRSKNVAVAGETEFMGWNIGPNHDLSLTKLGTYVFQVRYQDRVLTEQVFNVSR